METPNERERGGPGAPRADRRSSAVLFGLQLREARLRAGMTQDRLAEDAGTHAETVSLLELGKRAPGFEVLLRLSRALGVRPGALVDAVAAVWEVEP